MEKLEWKSLVSLSQGLDIYSSEFFIGIESKGFAGWMKKARRNWLERFLARSYFCRRYSFLSGHPWIHRESISKRYYREGSRRDFYRSTCPPTKTTSNLFSVLPPFPGRWIWRRWILKDGYRISCIRKLFERNEYYSDNIDL